MKSYRSHQRARAVNLAVVCLAITSTALLHSSPVELVTSRTSGAAESETGNGASSGLAISTDGRFILFVSSASDLVPNDNGFECADIFLRDRESDATTLVSINSEGSGGGNGSSDSGVLSANGRFVTFESLSSNLVPGDTNGSSDIFFRDLLIPTNQLVSVAIDGGPGNGASTGPVMTPDGRYAAFVSTATNLVAGDTNGIADVFVRDLLLQQTVCVTTGSVPPPSLFSNFSIPLAMPVITPDGRYVAFATKSRGLNPAVTSVFSVSEIYVRDLVDGTTTWVSSNAATAAQLGANRNYACFNPVISDNGRFVAFGVGTNNNFSTGNSIVFRFDMNDHSLWLIATNCAPFRDYDAGAFGPEMTPDGHFIASVAQYGNKFSGIQVWDALTGTNAPVSVDLSGIVSTQSISHTPVMSPDGRFLVFLSNGPNLSGITVSNGFHLYRRDLLAGSTEVLDVNSNGVAAMDFEGAEPAMSADGRWVMFSGLDTEQSRLEDNFAQDVFVRDVASGTTQLISRRNPTVTNAAARGASSLKSYSISADGRWLAFSSYANDIVLDDTNRAEDVFVCDLATGSNILVSAGADGLSARGAFSASPAISADGRFVAFVSASTNIVSGVDKAIAQIYRRDLRTETTALVSIGANGTTAPDVCSLPVISQDGRFVAFASKGNLGAGAGLYWRDIGLGTNVFLPGSEGYAGSTVLAVPGMSLDGRFVAYVVQSEGNRARVFDTTSRNIVFTGTTTTVGALRLSPDGMRLAHRDSMTMSQPWTLLDVASQVELASLPAGQASMPNSGEWSADGQIFAFVSTSNLLSSDLIADTNGTNDVYAYSLDGQLSLVSVNGAHDSSANGPSDCPSVSGDGRFIVFRSFASDVAPGSSPALPGIYVFDRFTGSNTALTIGTHPAGWTSWISKPAISAEGARVVFATWNAGLISGDLNKSSDILVTVVDAAADADNDDIPDSWLMDYFGHPNGDAADQSQAEDDPDQDGANNLQEFAAGTNPKDRESVFRGEIAVVLATQETVIKWPAVSGRNYRVDYTEDLAEGQWTQALGTISINNGLGSFLVPVDSDQLFYRISVK